MWVNIQRITGVPHCANVVWPDLEVKGENSWRAGGRAIFRAKTLFHGCYHCGSSRDPTSPPQSTAASHERDRLPDLPDEVIKAEDSFIRTLRGSAAEKSLRGDCNA